MNHCETCKHWQKNKHNRFVNVGICLSGNILDVTDIPPRKTSQEIDKFASDKLIYWDHEGDAAGACVGAKFGCVHHAKT